MTFGPGTRLTVVDPNIANITSPTVRLLPPSHKQLCKDKNQEHNVILLCLVTEFYPDHVVITWQVNGKERKDDIATDSIADQDPDTHLYRMSSRLSVKQSEWTNLGNNFTCSVRFYNGKVYLDDPVTIQFKEGKISAKLLALFHFGYLLCLCKGLLYAVFVTAVLWKCKVKKEKMLLDDD